MFTFLGSYPKVIITDYDTDLAQAIKHLQSINKSSGELQAHIQMSNSFITSNFQQRLSPQYLSTLSS